jgi:hypothetical protein
MHPADASVTDTVHGCRFTLVDSRVYLFGQLFQCRLSGTDRLRQLNR